MADGSVAVMVGAPAEYMQPIADGLASAGLELAHADSEALIVVWCAPAPTPKDFFELDAREWRVETTTLLESGFREVQRRLPPMLSAGWGRVVLVLRGAELGGETMTVHGAAAVSGAISMVRALARALGPAGITANAVVARDGAPLEAVGETVGYLCSDLAGSITGQILEVGAGAQ